MYHLLYIIFVNNIFSKLDINAKWVANLYLILALGVYQMMSRTEIRVLLLTSLDMSEGREFLRPIWWIVLPSDCGNENTILYTIFLQNQNFTMLKGLWNEQTKMCNKSLECILIPSCTFKKLLILAHDTKNI